MASIFFKRLAEVLHPLQPTGAESPNGHENEKQAWLRGQLSGGRRGVYAGHRARSLH